MKLLNTIEIEPLDYAKNEYESPTVSKVENPKDWSDFWYKCISDSHLQNLQPIELGSYLVDINKIGESELKTILKKELKDVDLSNIQEGVSQIIGGIVILENDKIILEPTCCGDISDIRNWEEVGNAQLNKWTQLWIGHPWIFYKRIDNYIAISDYTDYNLEDFNGISEKYKFSEQELLSEIKLCRNNQIKFENRISEILKELEIKNANEIAKLMTGNK
ncbi:hypothetical protein GCM10011344_00770 [Dokdonia pacifica]|uniref:Uncharacterized protein n=1 Tax=Dokdonia pacifica TaxID=1627892 RepID=A0A239CZE0_9FLAO|nr:hypothetical protein [Dokdonia pacifica]GGG04275.1 hypothetical protein GCM10011344_00770 [Dokdonia pacifica]SNS25480.1 hypothetical protein SAMN06265376_10963 [Dokdonia pacifica]